MKRMVSIVLTVLLIIGSSLSAFASPERFDNGATILNRVDKAFAPVIQNDFITLESVGIPTNNIVSYVHEDGGMTYDYTDINHTISKIRVDEDAYGQVFLDITEGSLHNTLFFTDDGKLYLDGKEVIFSETVTAQSPNTQVVANGYANEYTENPPGQTTSYDYTIYQSTYTVNSVNLQTKIKDVTSLALSTIIAVSLSGLPPYVGIAAGVITGVIGLNLKSLGERIAPDSAYFSYFVDAYGTSKSQPGLWTYTQNRGYFYPKANLQGECYYKVAYQNRYFY